MRVRRAELKKFPLQLMTCRKSSVSTESICICEGRCRRGEGLAEIEVDVKRIGKEEVAEGREAARKEENSETDEEEEEVDNGAEEDLAERESTSEDERAKMFMSFFILFLLPLPILIELSMLLDLALALRAKIPLPFATRPCTCI